MELPNPLYAFVTETEVRPTKAQGRYFYYMGLRTPVGDLKGIMWDAPQEGVDNNPAFPKLAEILSITDFKDDRDQYGSIKVSNGGFVRKTKEDLPEKVQWIAEPPKASAEDMEWAKKIIGDKHLWSHRKYRTFIKRCLEHHGKKLMLSPAATGVHHTYQGGLFVHTAEVLELCKAQVAATPPKYGFVIPMCCTPQPFCMTLARWIPTKLMKLV